MSLISQALKEFNYGSGEKQGRKERLLIYNVLEDKIFNYFQNTAVFIKICLKNCKKIILQE